MTSVTLPTEPGAYVGDIYYGDPVNTTLGTHRWDGTAWHGLLLPQEERNRIVLGALISWIAQSSVGVLSLYEAGQLLRVLEGMSTPEDIGLAHKVKGEQT